MMYVKNNICLNQISLYMFRFVGKTQGNIHITEEKTRQISKRKQPYIMWKHSLSERKQAKRIMVKYRNKGRISMEKRLTRGQAIRLKCVDCCCGSYAEVRNCPATECPLWRYRLGKEIGV